MKTAFPQFTGTVNIRLYSNIPFDNTYANHSLISREFKYNNVGIYTGNDVNLGCYPKERFIERKKLVGDDKYYTRYDLSGEYNFEYGNGLITSVVLELTPVQTNANYMRVKSHNTEGSEYYYYFITGITQINADTYRLSLELDVLMTYQDEFLQGIRNVPVFTQRKHCHRYTNSGLMPHCSDLRTGEEIFANIKPSIIESATQTSFKTSNMKKLQGIVWAYICMDKMQQTISDVESDLGYHYKSTPHPLAVACIPLNVAYMNFSSVNGDTITPMMGINRAKITEVMNDAVGNGNIHSIRLSPYPPFELSSTGDTVVRAVDSTTGLYYYQIGINHTNTSRTTPHWEWKDSKATIKMLPDSSQVDGLLFIINENKSDVDLDDLTLSGIKNTNVPTISSNRYLDPKLLFKPFKTYKLSSCYGSSEIFPELLFSEGVFSNANLSLRSVASSYIGDNTFYSGLKDTNDLNNETIIMHHNLENIGLSSNTNYVLPAGTNALDVFNSTQAQSFYQSKTASGIASGLTIAGGVGSVALGVVGAIGSLGMSAPMSAGLIAGGLGGIGSGIASLSNTIKSTQAKIEDLKNTPDSFNVAGSCFTSDYGRTDNLYPYVLVYRCSQEIIERANDYFYNYGYQVGRECYFNIELLFDNDVSHNLDNNVFGRTIFNYIQTNEDITNKINADMPLIVKQKLSSIFMKGITLWTFFGLSGMWNNTFALTTGTNPDNWFLKHQYDNTEYKQ